MRSECGVERLRRLVDALGAGEMVGVIDVVVVEGALDTVDESGDAAGDAVLRLVLAEHGLDVARLAGEARDRALARAAG